KNTVKESGPSFGGIFTILGPGGGLLALLPLLSEAAGVAAELAGAVAAGAACAPSALSFSVTELLIASTRASNCCWVMPAGGFVLASSRETKAFGNRSAAAIAKATMVVFMFFPPS